MSLLQSLFRRDGGEAVVEKSEVQDYVWGSGSLEDRIENGVSSSTAVNAHSAMALYRQSSAFATAVDKIASKVADLTIVMEDRSSGKLVSESDVLDLLFMPNGHETLARFVETAAKNYLIAGNAYWVAAGNVSRPPAELRNIYPTVVTVESASDDYFAASYNINSKYARGTYIPIETDGRIRIVPQDNTRRDLAELYHVRGYTSRHDEATGGTMAEAILLEIHQQIQGRQHNNAMLKNGAKPSLWLNLKKAMSRKNFKEAADALQGAITGVANSGRPIITQAGELDVKELMLSNRDMEFSELDKIARQIIYSRFNIPLPLIDTSSQTFSNYTEANRAFYSDIVLPTAEALLSGLSQFILPRFGVDPRQFRITYDPFEIAPLRKQMMEEVDALSKSGLLTLNELRERLPGVDRIQGGDAVFGPASTVPIVGPDFDTLQALTTNDSSAGDTPPDSEG